MYGGLIGVSAHNCAPCSFARLAIHLLCCCHACLQAAELEAQLEAAAEERSRLEQYAAKLEAEVCLVCSHPPTFAPVIE